MKLSSEAMSAVHDALEMLLNFRALSELKHNAQIDVTYENYLKKMGDYLRELCLNPHIRYRPKMLEFLDGIKTIRELFKDIEV